MKFKCIISIGLFLTIAVSCKKAEPYRIDRSMTKDTAMVVTAHPLASEIGARIMKEGGNAVDAAVASQFALAVVYPRAGNIGGGGFMIIRTAGGEQLALDYREKAPMLAKRDMYLDEAGGVIDSLSMYGHRASGVPGTVAGLLEAWEKYGAIRNLAQLLDPSIDLAENGFRINTDEADRLNRYRADFLKFNDHPIPFVKKATWKSGDLLVQSELANTLRKIRDEGINGFYQGETAARVDSQMRVNQGLIRKNDLLEYRAIWRKPIVARYKNYAVISMPPPSSGGLALGQLLKITERFDILKMGFHSLESIHLLTEAERRVYADRARHLGDSDFYPVPVDSLLDSLYLAIQMADFDPAKATLSDSVKGGQFNLQIESFETTHTSIIDPDRMAVSVTTTLNSNYGSKVVVDGAGFFLNNEMDDFSIKPGVANQFGLVGGVANAIEPGKRMLSSMTPTIVERDGELFMVLGSPGGSTIITSVFQVFLNVAEFGMSMTEAVKAGRFHHQWLPDQILYEEGTFDSLLLKDLVGMGHHLDPVDRIGLVKAILVTETGQLEGAGDPRSFDDAEGY